MPQARILCILCILYCVCLLYPRPNAHFLHVYLSYFTNPASWLHIEINACLVWSTKIAEAVRTLQMRLDRQQRGHW